MIIAIPASEDKIDALTDERFGRCPFFCLYNTRTGNHIFKKNSMKDGSGGESEISEETVAKAVENLNKFNIVGCLEHLDVFVQQIEELNNVKLNIGTTNINPLEKSKQTEQISDEKMEKVEKICQTYMKI